MAVVVVTNSNNRRNDSESTTNWSNDGGGGAGPQDEPDLVYQNTQSVSRKVGTTLGGLGFADPSTVDVTVAADSIAMLKGVWSNAAALVAAPSARHKIGSSSSDYYAYQIVDDGTRGDIDAPATRLWVVSMINPNVEAWRDVLVGTPVLTAVDFYSIQGDFTGSAKAENVAMDAIDLSPGLFLVGGDSTDPDGTFLDFIAHDEDTLVNRFGHVVTVGNTIFLQGAFVIGRNASATVTATVFTDSNRIIEFPGGRVDEGDNLLEFDLGNATTAINISGCVFSGAGRNNIKRWFDSDVEVDDTDDELDITEHGFLTGDAVQYSNEGGTNLSGLVDGDLYFVRAITADSIALYPINVGRSAAYSDFLRRTYTAAATGEQHSLIRTPITWPDILIVGTSGIAELDGCTLNNIGTVTFTSKFTIKNSTFNGVIAIILPTGGVLDTVVFNEQVTTEGIALIDCNDLENISGCTFTASPNGGHAVKGDTVATFDQIGNSYFGYGPNPAEFDGVTDPDTGDDTIDLPSGHGYVTGDAIYYNDRGNPTLGGLTNQRRYYLNVVTDTVTLHVTKADAVASANKVNLTTVQLGIMALESANAAFLNDSGGLITLNVSGGTSPTVRNTDGSSTVVQETVILKVTVKDDAGVAIENAQVAIYSDPEGPSETQLMNELTLSTGIAQENFTYVSDISVSVRVRRVPASPPHFIGVNSPQTITDVGLDITITLLEDDKIDIN